MLQRISRFIILLSSESDVPDTISECGTKAVVQTNYWKLGDENDDGNTDPDYPQDSITACEVDEEKNYNYD